MSQDELVLLLELEEATEIFAGELDIDEYA